MALRCAALRLPFVVFVLIQLVRPTVAKSFLASMRGLNAALLGTTCNFIRCIKPNAEMECGVYNNK